MKKIISVLTLGIILAFGFSINASANESIVDLYPYDQQACLEATNECTRTKVGDSNWDFLYYGHRYHVIGGSTRYVTEWEDDNADGFIDALEMTSTPYNAFASMILNDTDETVILKTNNARTDLTGTVHRKYAHFDELGKLQMFEDHISAYYIFNDGDAVNPDWRLATQTEIDAYDAADPKPDTTRHTHIRMALDSNDADGYVIEPLGYLKWNNADVDTSTAPESDWSTIIPGNPNNVTIPAGWTIISFGTEDRGSSNAKTTNYILTLPEAMIDTTVDPLVVEYTHQPASFNNLIAQDDDAGTEGINIVVDYNGSFDLPLDVTASWLNMFDDAGKIVNETEFLDYSVEIYQDDVLLQTITFTYDDATEVYAASEAVSVIDSSVFGSGYTAIYKVTNPEGQETEEEVDIVIGVMPPKFIGVEDRYISEGVFVDLLEGIIADDGYGNDVTDSVLVTVPDGFNFFNTKPGEYTIDLEFTHHVHFDGVEPVITFGGVDYTWDPEAALNQDIDINAYRQLSVFTETTHFTDSATSWSSVIVVVAADGTVKEVYNRYNWEHTTSTGVVVTDGTIFAAWQAALTLEEGEWIVAAHGTDTPGYVLRDVDFGDPISYVVGYPDFDYDIITNTSYTLTVDDVTAPQALVLKNDYQIKVGDYSTADEAILSNVAAFDFYDSPEDLAKYVSNNGGLDISTPGTYSVEVTVEDQAGNTAVVSFDIEVVAALLTAAEIQALIDGQTLTEAEIQALIDGQTLTETEIQALIDAAIDELPEDETGASLLSVILVAVTSVFVLGAAGAVTLIKRP